MSNGEEVGVATVRKLCAAFNRGDLDAAIEGFDPAVKFFPPGGQTPLEGAAAFREWMEPDALEDQKIEPVDFRVNGDRVLVRQHITARGAGSGIELDMTSWAVWTLNEAGLVARVETFLPHEEPRALEATGLSE